MENIHKQIEPINAIKEQKEIFNYYINLYEELKINSINDEIIIKDIIQNIMLIYRRIFVGNYCNSLSKYLRDNIGDIEFELPRLIDYESSVKGGVEMPCIFNMNSPNIPNIYGVFEKNVKMNIITYLTQKTFVNTEIKDKQYGITIKEYIDTFLDKQIVHLDLEVDEKYEKHLIIQSMQLGGYQIVCPYIYALELLIPLFGILDDIINKLK